MENKNESGIKHSAHKHWLILNENYVAKEDDVCWGCEEQIDSFHSSVYSCSNITSTTSDVDYQCFNFLLHKACAELPLNVVNPADPNEFLAFRKFPQSFVDRNLHINCKLCFSEWYAFCYSSSSNYSYICLKCAVVQVQQSKEDLIFEHPGHSHPLALIEHPSSFQCYACKVNDGILESSYRCTRCQFWIHKSCGDAPPSFQFQLHKHPLFLSFFLPEIYHKFPQFCRICNERLHWKEWIYCCRNCRYFTHFQCARSSPSLSSSENETYPNLVHFPATDELFLNLLLEQFIKDKITVSDSCNNSSIFSATNYIKHWSHKEHELKLITINELYDRKNDDNISLLCDGCVKPIRTCDSLFYACVPCKYFLHKACAEFPRKVKHQLGPDKKLSAKKYREAFKLFKCYVCRSYSNGIFFSDHLHMLHVGCVTLPKVIKHEAHNHELLQLDKEDFDRIDACNACGWRYFSCNYGCKGCKFYICGRCVMKARTYKHRWDPHPLDLKYDAGMVEEHEHEFVCEFCSEDIDTNKWFYHCSKCDLSFHTPCILESSYRLYKDVKFGATDIIIKDQVHPHRLTFVLNKKVRSCMNCKKESFGRPVLHCAPCNSTIFCYDELGRWCRP